MWEDQVEEEDDNVFGANVQDIRNVMKKLKGIAPHLFDKSNIINGDFATAISKCLTAALLCRDKGHPSITNAQERHKCADKFIELFRQYIILEVKQRRESEASGVHFLGWEKVPTSHKTFQNEVKNPLNREDIEKAFEDSFSLEVFNDTQKQDRDIALLEKSAQARIRKQLAIVEAATEESDEATVPVQLHLSKSKIQGNPKKQKIWKALAEIDTNLERARDAPKNKVIFQMIKQSLMSTLRKQKSQIMQNMNGENIDRSLRLSFNLLYQIRLIVQNIENGSVTGARKALKKMMEENTGNTEKIPTTANNTSTGPERTGQVTNEEARNTTNIRPRNFDLIQHLDPAGAQNNPTPLHQCPFCGKRFEHRLTKVEHVLAAHKIHLAATSTVRTPTTATTATSGAQINQTIRLNPRLMVKLNRIPATAAATATAGGAQNNQANVENLRNAGPRLKALVRVRLAADAGAQNNPAKGENLRNPRVYHKWWQRARALAAANAHAGANAGANVDIPIKRENDENPRNGAGNRGPQLRVQLRRLPQNTAATGAGGAQNNPANGENLRNEAPGLRERIPYVINRHDNPRNPDDQNGARRKRLAEIRNRHQRQIDANWRKERQYARMAGFRTIEQRLLRQRDVMERALILNRENRRNQQNRQQQPAVPKLEEDPSTSGSGGGRGRDFFVNLIENPNFALRCKINPFDLEEAILNAFKNLPDFYSEDALIQIQDRIMNAVFNPSINNLVTLNINSSMGKTVARHIRAALTMILGRPPTQEDLDGNNNQIETSGSGTNSVKPDANSDNDVQIIELEEKVKEIIDILDDNENDPKVKSTNNNGQALDDKKKIKNLTDFGQSRTISKFLDVRLGKEPAWINANFRLRSSNPDITMANFERYDGIVVDKLKITAVKQANNDVILKAEYIGTKNSISLETDVYLWDKNINQGEAIDTNIRTNISIEEPKVDITRILPHYFTENHGNNQDGYYFRINFRPV